jgi:uncharacterized protein (TIGR03083 family)
MQPAPARTNRNADPLTHADWMAAARTEYTRLDTLLAGLAEDEWLLPTDCAGWAVRDVVAHLIGAAESMARLREGLRQVWCGRKMPAKTLVDRMNAVQVSERAHLPVARLRADLAEAGARGVRARTRLPGPLRRVPLPFGPPLGTRPLGYLTDRIYTRDAWMHRIDLARATGRPVRLSPEHDGRLVGDIVVEWAAKHGQPYRLTLTGSAGGSWQRGIGDAALELDAVEFARTMAGRRPPDRGLLRHGVPF